MDIAKKLEEMRNQPEHIRLRYVWISVAVSMVVIIIVWIFSLTALFQQKSSGENTQAPDKNISELKQQLGNLKQASTSLKDYTNTPLNVGRDNTTPTQNNSVSDISDNAAQDLPQSDQYSPQSQQ